MTAIKLSIVVGVQHAQENVTQIIRALAPALHPEVEILFCHTAADPDVPALIGTQGHVRVIPAPAGHSSQSLQRARVHRTALRTWTRVWIEPRVHTNFHAEATARISSARHIPRPDEQNREGIAPKTRLAQAIERRLDLARRFHA